MASSTQWTRVWANSGRWWRTGKLSVLQFTGSKRVRQLTVRLNNWTTIHASKVMFKILHARPQNNVNQELPDVQAGFRKGRGTRYQIAKICWVTEKTREFQKNIYLCFIEYTKAFVDHNKLWKALLSPCHTFSILSHSVVLHSVLIVSSWPAYRFLRRQNWYSHLFKSFPQKPLLGLKNYCR